MFYALVFFLAYAMALMWARCRLAEEKLVARHRLRQMGRFTDPEIEQIVSQSDDFTTLLGPTFLFGTLAGCVFSALIWFFSTAGGG